MPKIKIRNSVMGKSLEQKHKLLLIRFSRFVLIIIFILKAGTAVHAINIDDYSVSLEFHGDHPNEDEYFGINKIKTVDVTGDGFNDLLIPASSTPPSNTGSLYIFKGSPNPDSIKDIQITGEGIGGFFPNVNGFDFGVADVNSDGIIDLLLGALGFNSYSGKAYFLPGSISLSTDSINNLTTGSFLGDSGSFNMLGATSSINDFNGDGFYDILLSKVTTSTTSSLNIFFGNGTVNWGTNPLPDIVIQKPDSNTWGFSSMGSGYFNDDKYADVFVSENVASPHTSIYLGGETMSDTPIVEFIGESTNPDDDFGSYDVADINKNGIDDLCLGAYRNANGGVVDSGSVYCIYDPGTISGSVNLSEVGNTISGFKLSGYAARDNFGRVIDLHDINLDGNQDLIVGAYQSGTYSNPGSKNGYVEIFMGIDGDISTTPDLHFDYDDIAPGEAGKKFGNSVHAGDLNNDGWQELFFGFGSDVNPSLLTGKIYMLSANRGDPQIVITTENNMLTKESQPNIQGQTTDSGVNIAGTEWSFENQTTSIWQSCVPSDGSFNSISEDFICTINGSSLDDGEYTVYFRSYDENDFYMPPANYISTNFTIDSTPPTGSILINDNQTLTISASDNLSGVSQMLISTDESFTNGVWEPYSNSKNWVFSPGEQTIYIKFQDNAGNISANYSYSTNIPYELSEQDLPETGNSLKLSILGLFYLILFGCYSTIQNFQQSKN